MRYLSAIETIGWLEQSNVNMRNLSAIETIVWLEQSNVLVSTEDCLSYFFN